MAIKALEKPEFPCELHDSGSPRELIVNRQTSLLASGAAEGLNIFRCFPIGFSKHCHTEGHMSSTKTKYTPSEALRVVDGLHRKRLYDMMNHGEISYLTTDQGKREIDGAELARVFGEKFRPLATLPLGPENVETQRETEEKHHRNTPTELEVHVLRERLAAREQMLEEQAKAIHELREERDEWRKMAQSLHQQTQMLFLPEGRAAHAHKGSFWQRVFGKAR